jgi:predicted GIY-YIG superfamily endonuclease
MRYIYVLKDPETNEIRYVGQTDNLKRRFNKHISNTINENSEEYNTYKSRWIRKLLEKNIQPIIEIIEEVETLDISNKREKFWIKKLTNEGINLTNSYVSDVTIFSVETKDKMSVAKKGKKLEEIVGEEKAKELKKYYSERIKINNPNKSSNLEVKEKISNTLKEFFKDKTNHWAFGKEMSEKMKENLRKSHLNNPKNVGNKTKRTEEQKEKIRNKILGSKIERCKILQYDLEGIFIKRWNSIREICREEITYNRATLNKNINKGKSYAGYIWKKETLD